MLKAVTMNYVGRNRAWGGFTTQGAQPDRGIAVDHASAASRAPGLAQYGAAGIAAGDAQPAVEARHRSTTISDDQTARTRSIRLSAALSVGMFAGDGACDKVTVRSNDGKRRIDVLF